MSKQHISDPSKGKYFTQVLNMADDDLGPYEMRLLVRYIRVAWKTGKCWEGVRKTAKITQMSVGMVTKTRNRLEELGYIKVKHRQDDTCVIAIVDRMAENVARYANEVDEEDEFEVPSRKRARTTGTVHVVNTRSSGEQGVHVVNTSELEGVHVVNERITRTNQEEPKKKKETTLHDASASRDDVSDSQENPAIAPVVQSITAVTQSLQGETENSAPAENRISPAVAPSPSLKPNPSTAEDTTAPIPSAASPLSPVQVDKVTAKTVEVDTPKSKRSVAQQAQDDARRIAMNALAEAMNMTLTKPDERRWSQIAQTLIAGTIPHSEFTFYVKRLKEKAKSEGNWTVTVESLIKNGRISEYVTAREEYRKRQTLAGQNSPWTGSTVSSGISYHEPSVAPLKTRSVVSQEERIAALEEIKRENIS